MAFSKKAIKTGSRLLVAIAKKERKQNLAWSRLHKRTEGKLVIVGWDLDRVIGIYSTLGKALEALDRAPGRNDHNWWLEFRKVNHWSTTSLFERILVRTDKVSGS
jgi:hypothetical protein